VSVRKSLLPAPVLTYLGANRWRLEKPYVYEGMEIHEGFEFDLASIPRALWWLIAPFDLSIVAPLVHDWLYRNGGGGRYTRQGADDVFLRIMVLEGVPGWRRISAWRIVRLFGGGLWRS
jgi:hypothetical protein